MSRFVRALLSWDTTRPVVKANTRSQPGGKITCTSPRPPLMGGQFKSRAKGRAAKFRLCARESVLSIRIENKNIAHTLTKLEHVYTHTQTQERRLRRQNKRRWEETDTSDNPSSSIKSDPVTTCNNPVCVHSHCQY